MVLLVEVDPLFLGSNVVMLVSLGVACDAACDAASDPASHRLASEQVSLAGAGLTRLEGLPLGAVPLASHPLAVPVALLPRAPHSLPPAPHSHAKGQHT